MMTRVPRHEILLALLTSLDNNVANIPRLARFALPYQQLSLLHSRVFQSLVRGISPMSVLNKTFYICCAAVLSCAFSNTNAFAGDANSTGSGNPSDMDQIDFRGISSEKYDFNLPSKHWSEAEDQAKKRSPVDIQRFQTKEGSGKTKTDVEPGEQQREKVDPGAAPGRAVAFGQLLPYGQYEWDGRYGQIPNPTLGSPGGIMPFTPKDSGYAGIKKKMQAAIDPLGIRTTPITNWEMSTLLAAQAALVSELRTDPERMREATRQAQETKQAASADNTAQMAEGNEDTGWDNVYLPLINIANEDAWVKCDSHAPFKTYQNVAWMVGQMYKQVYIPMAILFLLPGAVMTQAKVVIRTGFLFGGNDEDTVSPWSGIMRAMIAVFLIPATQLFMSYCIDVGNSLTYEVTHWKSAAGDLRYDLNPIREWRNEQTFHTKNENQQGHIRNNPEKKIQGKLRKDKEGETKFENQHYLSSTAAQWFNTMSNLIAQGMVCLNAFQFVMVLYLFLMGPIAAALFAWPGVARETFRKVFANWMNGVVLVTLWKFWWAIILLIMSIRLQLIQQDGGLPPREDPFEMYMCAAFTAMLMYIPFNPFDFRPGDLVSSVLEKAQQQTSKGGGGAAAAGGTGGVGGGGGGSGGGQNSGVQNGGKE